MSKYNYLFKIVIIGDHNCGKSCILLRFAESTFRDDHITTIGVDFKLKTIKLDKDKIRLELWDTAGMERYRTIYNSYYHSAHGVMVVYDITDKRSFEHVKNYWFQEVRKHAPHNAVVMLIGNKCDLVNERKVDFITAEKFASESCVSLFELSAKTGINVEEAFLELTSAMRERVMLSRMGRWPGPLHFHKNVNFQLFAHKLAVRVRGSCCRLPRFTQSTYKPTGPGSNRAHIKRQEREKQNKLKAMDDFSC